MPAKPNEILITRVYDAPVKLVWEAWTDPKKAAKWWGPRGFTLTTKSKDLRPGGQWIYTMHGPDGKDWPNIATYHEVVKYEKLVYDHGATETTPPLFRVTVTFKEDKGKTTMTMISAFATPDIREQMGKFIKEASGNSTWDRLAEYIVEETEGKDAFVINHSFPTDIATAYSLWTDPVKYAKWMGPAGSKMTFLSADFREGGKSRWSMEMPTATVMYGVMNHKQLVPNRLVVYSQNFSDEKGNLAKFPFISTYPDQVLTTVILAEEEGGQTRITLKWEILGDATEAERKTFHGMKSSMNQGWEQSFDRFEALVTGQ